MTTVVASEKNKSRFVIRFVESEFDRISDTLERFGGPQMCGERLIRWFVEQDSLLQSMIQGQIEADDELVDALLKRLQTKRRQKARSGSTASAGEAEKKRVPGHGGVR